MLGELAREREAHGGLDLARREGALLVVAHELAGLVAILSKMSEMKEFMIDMPLDEMPVSGCTCLSTL